MIHQVLPFIAQELNTHFKLKYGIDDDRVVVSGLVDQNGNPPVEAENKLLFSLINIEEEKLNRAKSAYVKTPESGSFTKRLPAIRINLLVIFTANFAQQNYLEALKFISGILGFFQFRNTFTASNSPGIPGGVEKLSVEIISYDILKMNQLWGTIGNKYQPSVIYRIRTLEIQEDTAGREVTEITGF